MIGAVIGRLSIKNNWGTNGVLLNIFVIMIVSFLLLFLQTIIHELGHLVFGLISKYKFLSFRIGSLTLIKIDGKYKLKSMKIAGTAGQCLLIPPEVEPNKLPITLYLLGGGLFNLISSGIAFGLYILLPKNDFSFFILFVF